MPVSDKPLRHAQAPDRVDEAGVRLGDAGKGEVCAGSGGDHSLRAFANLAAPQEIDSISRLVLDTVSEGIFCLGPDGLTTFLNPAAARMLGRTVEELIGRHQHEIIHHSYVDGTPYPIHSCPVQATLETGQSVTCEDEVFWRMDGTSFAVAYTCTPIHRGDEITGAVVVFRDISERVRRDRWQRSKDTVFQAITTHAELDGTLQLLADAYTAYETGSSVAILLRDHEEGDILSLIASSGLSETLKTQLQIVRIEQDVSVCGHAAFIRREIIVDSRTNMPIDVSAGASSELPVEIPVDARRNGPQRSRFLEFAGRGDSRCLALPMTAADGEVLGVIAFLIALGGRSAGSQPIAFSLPVALHLPRAVAEHGGFRGVRDLAQIAVEQRNLQIELVHQSQHDRLTGLPNWILLEERLNQMIRSADRTHTRIAICSLDLDRFRRINENHGHVAGDDILQQIAARLRDVLRKGDTLGRQGGDEFIVLIPDLSDPADADAVCRKLLAALNEPFRVDGKSVTVAANIGISIYPDHARTAELLVQHADTALDFAKEKGQARLKLFRPDLGQKVRQLAAREAALQTALQKKELYLMYQPLFDANRQVHGFEALLRWQHPELGLIPPDQFIPLAEDTGLILPIGDWVLREACRQAMAWSSTRLAETKIFVNISALQLGQADFTHSVGYALKLSGLPPSRLELEVTESFIVPSFKKATQRLQPLQDLGVSIAIDDFGTGHSSFSVLHKLPINAIKVDRSFVSRIDKDPSGLSTVRAIVNLAHQLGMKTVGEGVETEAQFKLLNDMECEFYQGYLLSKPLSVDAVDQMFGEAALPVTAKVNSPGKTTSISDGPGFRKSA